MHYRADSVALAIVGVLFSAQLGLFLFASDPRLLVGGAALLVLPQGLCIACAHHHAHLRVFRSAVLNRLYDTVLFLQTGLPTDAWVLNHCLGHHGSYLDPRDDPNGWRAPDGAPLSKWSYVWRTCVGYWLESYRVGQRHAAELRSFLRWSAAYALLLAALLAWAPLQTLVVFLVPMGVTTVRTALLGYAHHAGVTGAMHADASRSFVNPLFNLLSLNSGLHAAHHASPELHWSLLGEAHARMESRIPPHLLVREFWG